MILWPFKRGLSMSNVEAKPLLQPLRNRDYSVPDTIRMLIRTRCGLLYSSVTKASGKPSVRSAVQLRFSSCQDLVRHSEIHAGQKTVLELGIKLVVDVGASRSAVHQDCDLLSVVVRCLFG